MLDGTIFYAVAGESLWQGGKVVSYTAEHAPLGIGSEHVAQSLLNVYADRLRIGQTTESVRSHTVWRRWTYVYVRHFLASAEDVVARGLQADG